MMPKHGNMTITLRMEGFHVSGADNLRQRKGRIARMLPELVPDYATVILCRMVQPSAWWSAKQDAK